MKVCIITATLLSLSLLSTAEPPPQASAPYQPSGWRPSGALFLLPARQQAQQVYGPPPLEYGPPLAGVTPEPTTTEADIPTTDIATDQPEEIPDGSGADPRFQQQQEGVNAGLYYVLLPDGRLQRVEYQTSKLPQPAAFTQAFTPLTQSEQPKADNAKNASQSPSESKFQSAPQSQYSAPQAQYNAPQNQYSAPQAQYRAPQAQYNAPQAQYRAPQAQYNAPQAQYSAPQAQYNAPQAQYRAPQAQYNAPQGQYSAPQAQYRAPQAQYNAPQAQYSAPQAQYNAPQAQYNAPQSQYASATKSQYSAQQGQYTTQQKFQNNPQSEYIEPESQYNAPQNKYSTPQKFQNAPQSQYQSAEQSQKQNQFGKFQAKPARLEQNQYPSASNSFQTKQRQQDDSDASNKYLPPQTEYTQLQYEPAQFAIQPSQQQVAQPAMFTGFVANVQYRDIEPITAPIYTYNPAPLIRILKK